jgi:hypothetical protein
MNKDIFNFAHKGDYKSLVNLNLNVVNEHNRTILHIAALNHNLDFLFVCTCLGIDQTIVDSYGKTFVDYLSLWEYFHIKQLKIIWKIEKIKINTFHTIANGPIEQHAFLVDSFGSVRPMLCQIWEKDLGIEELEKVLECAIDLDNKYLQTVRPPEKYQCLLAEYGWVPNYPLSCKVLLHSKKFYNPSIWPIARDDYTKWSFKTMNIAKIPTNILGQTIVCLSDVHYEYKRLHVPGGDILVCAGDSAIPKINDLSEYIEWFGSHNHPFKILIAGNHDKVIQNNKEYYNMLFKRFKINYLEDTSVTINGLNFYGTPWTAKRPKNKNNAFTLSRRDLMKKWNQIPLETNVLISHSPPFGIGDMNSDYYRGVPYQCGDPGLRKTINRLHKLKVHIFGHQHFGKGIYEGTFPNKRTVYFVNCALPQDPFPTVL